MVALRLLAGSVAFLATIQVWCIGASLLGLRMSQALAVGGLAVAVLAGIGLAGRIAARSDAVRATVGGGEESRGTRWADRSAAVVAAACFLWLGWIWVRLLLVAWQREPLGWDALWYHIPAVHEWMMRGRVAFLPLGPGLDAAPLEVLTAGWVNFPMGVELTGFFSVYLLGTDRLIDGANLWYWPLAVLSLVVIARRLGARGPWAWLAGGLLFGAALFLTQSASLYIDPGFSAAVMASMAGAMVVLFPRPADRPLWTAVLFGAALGLTIGSKGPGLPYAGAIGLLAAGVVLWRARYARLRRPLIQIAIALGVLVAVGGYWPIRNAVNTGNPMYPVLVRVGHKVLAHGYDFGGYAELDWVVREPLKPYPTWSRMFVSWLQPESPLLADDPDSVDRAVGGLGFLWLAGALPAILYLWGLTLKRGDAERRSALAFLSAVVLVLLALTTLKWQGRYTYWLYGLGLPAMAVVLSDAAARLHRSRWHLAPLLLGLVALGVAGWESSGTLELEVRSGRVVDSDGRVTYRSTLDRLWPGMGEAAGFRELLAADRVARGPWASGGTTRFGGALANPLGRREIVVLPPSVGPDRIAALRDDGVRWVLWTASDPDSIPAAVQRGSCRYAYGRGETRYYAFDLTGCPTAAGGSAP